MINHWLPVNRIGLSKTVGTLPTCLFFGGMLVMLGAIPLWGGFAFLGCRRLYTIAPVNAQSIHPAPDGTGTLITPNGTQIDIHGGSLSGDGANLFHSFQRFGLSSGEIANFLSQPQVQNILGRVVGGEASTINGLIQVTGSNANLFLMNPAGLVFGPHASLNVPASFTATTATSIRLEGGNFNTFGANHYSSLTGSPNQFIFAISQPGSVINTGHLAVSDGESLTLLGGNAINTGSLTAPGGTITVAAVPGESLVSIQQEGMVLRLVVEPLKLEAGGISNSATTTSAAIAITPATIPQLLTAPELGHATGVAVDNNGRLRLTGSGLAIPTADGTTVVSGRLDVSSPQVVADNREIRDDGALAKPPPWGIALLGETVAAIDAEIDASGPDAGGTVWIGGGYQGNDNLPAARRTLVGPNSTITADAQQNGQGGKVIVWADDWTGFYGSISARGGSEAGDGGFVEVSGKDRLTFRGQVDVGADNGSDGSILLDPQDIIIVPSGGLPDDVELDANVPLPPPPSPEGEILFGDGGFADFTISDTRLTGLTGNIRLEASQDIIAQPGASLNFFNQTFGETITFEAGRNIDISTDILTDGGNIFFTASTGSISAGNITTSSSSGGEVSLVASGPIQTGTIDTSGSFGDGGTVTLESSGSLDLDDIDTTGDNGGDVFAIADDVINIRLIDTTGFLGDGGAVTLESSGSINTSDIYTDGFWGDGGAVTLDARSYIDTGDIYTTGDNGGAVFAIADDVIDIGLIDTNGFLDRGGDVTLRSEFSDIDLRWIDAQGETFGGSIELEANFVRATEVFFDRNGILASLSSAGDLGGGPITIRHSGNSIVPFTLGNASQNGTAGAITSGEFSLFPSDELFLSTIEGNIQILTTGEPVTDNDGNPNSQDPSFACDRLCDFRPRRQQFPGFRGFSSRLSPLGEVGEAGVAQIDGSFSNHFERRLGLKKTSPVSLKDARVRLKQIEQITGLRSALIYVFFKPAANAKLTPAIAPAGSKSLPDRSTNPGDILWQFNRQGLQHQPEQLLPTPTEARTTDQLELMLVTAEGTAIRRQVQGADRREVEWVARRFLRTLTRPAGSKDNRYLAPSQQLYRWLVAPLEKDLRSRNINNLTFLMDAGLRTLPVAALHNGEEFIIERFSLGLMPSLALTDTRYVDLRNTQVLAMGADTFNQLKPLPAVSVELSAIAGQLWQGQSFLNEEFTLENLQKARASKGFGILHLATHADFRSGLSSYIQLGNNQQLTLDQLQTLNLGEDPPVELLVLSACRTALGDVDAELGFAGLAVIAGVKSAMGSLWSVNDEGTLGLMMSFYERLRQTPVKAEALRQAQLDMLQGKVYLQAGQLVTPQGRFPLPSQLIDLQNRDLRHPYYWSAFAMIGNPW